MYVRYTRTIADRHSDVLPALVESVRTSWITTFQSAAVVSSLLAGVSGGLLSAINDDYDSVAQFRESIRSFLYIAAFGAILLNISATMTSLVLIERLSGLQWNAAKRHWAANNGFVVNFDGVSLLSDFGVHKLWRYLIWHWLISLIAGMWCMLFEIIMFVWVSQKTTNAAKIAMTCFMVFTALPLIIIQSLPIRTLLKAAGRDK
ncbi:hypothetical protein CPB85DRAFT_844022 [Mucidula mucida]|nr:hypothetical protein CPB85DRAFT_844022 [Mucidula mucida]